MHVMPHALVLSFASLEPHALGSPWSCSLIGGHSAYYAGSPQGCKDHLRAAKSHINSNGACDFPPAIKDALPYAACDGSILRDSRSSASFPFWSPSSFKCNMVHLEKLNRALSCAVGTVQTARSVVSYPPVNMVLPVLREWGCGHANMETPRFIKGFKGKGMVIVDVGLGTDARESLDAVSRGFVVFAVEPNVANFASIKAQVKRRNLATKIRFVEPTKKNSGTWEITPPLAKPANLSAGFGFIILAAADSEAGSIITNVGDDSGAYSNVFASALGINRRSGRQVEVAKLALADIVPSWVDTVDLMKIDTQGLDYRVLQSAEALLTANRVRYVLFEFSPLLMAQINPKTRSKEPLAALKYLPSLGGICFDMMGGYTPFPDRGKYVAPIRSYYNQLTRSLNWDDKVNIGPWDDIMCYFPMANGRGSVIDRERTERWRSECGSNNGVVC